MRLNKTFIFLVCLALMTSMAWGLSHQTGKVQSTNVSQILDTRTYLDKNKLLAFIYNDGNFCYDNANVLGKTDGLYFPRGSKKTVIYASGLWVGAKVDGATRMAVAEFSSEFVPGPMANGTYQDDQASFRVYKINRGDDANNNSDYANWPANQGAPVDDLGNPALLGDQMCWTVFNDADPAKHRNTAASTAPLGVEIQESAFAFGRSGALGQVIFLKFLIINKGGNTLEDTYVSLWCDPDLGGASDDLVGCDTSLSLGYCYNDAGSDNTYGTAPPAVGFDFFQGPIVESENPNDSAKFRGEWIQGYRNLPMTSFNRYINGTDPHSYSESYNYMQGLEPTGEPLIDNNDDTTTYFFAGDPVEGTGWLDGNSADRRFMMSSGPFTMEPDDTQEVVAAICVGQGANRLSSVTALRTVDLQAQTVFDQNFDIPSPPPTPTVFTRGYDGKIDLVWTDSSINYVQDYRASLGQFYCFEGYNIYQAESPTGPWTRVATYDYEPSVMQRVFEDTVGANIVVCNEDSTSCDTIARPWDFTKIYQDIANPAKGGSERIIQQAGTNSGLVHHLSFSTSFLDGGPIINNRPYYFAVAPYAVDVDKVTSEDSFFVGQNFEGFVSEPLENVLVPVTAIGKSSGAVFIDTAQHVSGPSQGMAIVEYLNYTDTTADDYEVVFDTETDGSVVWDLKKNGTVVLEDQSNQGGGYDYEIYNGLMVRVMGPDPDIAPSADASNGGVIETATADGTIDPDNVFWSWNSTGEYYVSSDVPGSGYDARSRFNWRQKMGWEAWEFRFTANGSEYYDWLTDAKWDDRTPFEIWHFSEDATEPDRQDIFFIIDDDESGGWTPGDRIYISETTYPSEPIPDNAGATGYVWDDDFHLGRIVINAGTPATGTVIRFNSTIPNSPADKYTFTTKPTGMQDGTVVAKELEDIRVVPNPYYNLSPLEIDQFDRSIKFINLPPTKCTIRIFNVAGDLVRVLNKEDLASAEMSWDVKTENGLYVASGIYVYYIEAEGIGDTFGKMVVFTEVEQLKTF